MKLANLRTRELGEYTIVFDGRNTAVWEGGEKQFTLEGDLEDATVTTAIHAFNLGFDRGERFGREQKAVEIRKALGV